MLRPPFWPVSQATKVELPWNSSPPDEFTEKPEVPVAPWSHWNWVVGSRIWVSLLTRWLILYQELHTGHDAATAVFVGDGTVGNAELRSGKAAIANAHLTITQLAEGTGHAPRGSEVEAAAISTAHKGVGAGSEGRESDEALHLGKRLRAGIQMEAETTIAHSSLFGRFN